MNIKEALEEKLQKTLEKVQAYLQNCDSNETKCLPSLPIVVEEARREWLDAQYYYNAVTDQDLVDHAVYLMQAAEKKYMYLLKQARHDGVVYSPYMTTDINSDTNIDVTH